MDKLLAIQTELKAPKNQYNSFGKYKYRSAEDILEAVKPLCKKHECVLTLSDELVNIGDRYYIKATARLHDDKVIGDTVIGDTVIGEVTAYAREEESKKGMDGCQITGTASSYARKYALNGLFLIDDTKDADTNAYKEQQQVAEEEQKAVADMQKKITKLEATTISGLAKSYGSSDEEVLAYCGIEKYRDMTKAQYGNVFKMLEQKYGKKE